MIGLTARHDRTAAVLRNAPIRFTGALGSINADAVEAASTVPAGPGQLLWAADAARRLLGGLHRDQRVVTALPFDADVEALLVVPAASKGLAACQVDAGAVTSPAGRRAGSVVDASRAAYLRLVAEALEHIARGEVEKVVLARTVSVDLLEPPDLDALLARMGAKNAAAHRFCVPTASGGAFVGASPETVIRKRGREVVSVPLAGTAARSADLGDDARSAQALRDSGKDRREHSLVVEAVADSLAPHCVALTVEGPSLLATSTVWHLATTVRGTLRDADSDALMLAAALHPTPAVCGTPRDAALDLIRRLEKGSRGLYAGLVGWVDGRGDGEWALSVRCAEVRADRLVLHAGAGIVAGSEPEAELRETDAKLRTMLEAIQSTP